MRTIHAERARLLQRAADRDARKERVSARRAEVGASQAKVYGPGGRYLARWPGGQGAYQDFQGAVDAVAVAGSGRAPAGSSVALVTFRKGKPACVVGLWLVDAVGAWVAV